MEDDTFEEQVALREQIPAEGLALMSVLLERDMQANFETINQLYESEKRDNEELRREVAELRLDASRWRQFVAMVQDTISPWEEQ